MIIKNKRKLVVNVLGREKKIFYENKIDKSKGTSKNTSQTIKQLLEWKKEICQ